MSIPQNNQLEEREEQNESTITSTSADTTEDDGTPVLDEQDLEENDLSVEEVDNIEWEEPQEEEK